MSVPSSPVELIFLVIALIAVGVVLWDSSIQADLIRVDWLSREAHWT